ncbi:MBOAT family protein [Echinicola marina]|uniref:MBOAT family O-acyltransferase n=1 Tax=Echinicola marina TaxID=2859768 RepID=UPI001CF611AF|nr:MBOAT family O-acyltransferase [Echinicola marina]UCS91978.1 MBOAT family protein [Echinicola marina]
MLFNSFEFLIFLPIVFLLYWAVFQKNLKAQNTFLLLASYVFYGWWDWRFLSLIIVSSWVDYLCGLKMGSTPSLRDGSKTDEACLPGRQAISFKNNSFLSWFKGRKKYLTLSIAFNLGLLGFFKYFNFFMESATDLINTIGFQSNDYSLKLILPVGISFYTFQTMSYTIDVYKGKLKPTNDIIAFFAYVSFFPQLVAGPIERAKHLLPQFFKQRNFVYEQGTEGVKLILWGLFKKVVIADNCAIVVNPIFENYTTASGLELIMGAVLFAFQIYGDFSGYSDIAIGVGKLLGFDLMTNFKTPYFSRDIAEFWRRWHISLSTWFRDYVYIPLGGSKVGKWLSIRNIFIVFLVSGLWHGANWTFVFWGGLNALFFIPLFIRKKNRQHIDAIAENRLLPTWNESLQILMTFTLVCLAWIFFRSESLNDAMAYIQNLVVNPFMPKHFGFINYDLRMALVLFIVLEWVGREKGSWLQLLPRKRWRYAVYVTITYFVIYLGVFSEPVDFIYFQF